MPLFYTGVIMKETSPRAMRSIIHLPEQAVCKNRASGIFLVLEKVRVNINIQTRPCLHS